MYADPRLLPRMLGHSHPPSSSKPLDLPDVLWYELCVAQSRPWLIVIVVVGKVKNTWRVGTGTPFEEFEAELGLASGSTCMVTSSWGIFVDCG